MTTPYRLLPLLAVGLVLAGCSREGDLVLNEGVGVTAVRTPCPAVGIPDFTGDVTLFRDGGAATVADLDVSATITNLTSSCNDTGPKVETTATFDVLARRSDTRGARQVVLPYYASVLRGGSAIVSKRVGQVVLNFADGEERARAQASAGASVDRNEATLPEEVRQKIVRKREAGDEDAALDPLADPAVRAAVQRATFELLVGFQLTEAQLRYNATR